jgi:CheY-like chemotaxis protein
MKILLSDDDVIFGKTLKHVVTGQGHQVALTHTGTDAWEAYQENPH